MTPALLTLTLAAVLAADADVRTHRAAASVRAQSAELTDEEEEQLDKIIDAWILYDSGQLGGEAGRKARADFQKLGPESIFALIRGLNRAAEIEHSCPAVTIAKKIHSLLFASDDLELLEFARENIGIGVKATRHLGVIGPALNSTMGQQRGPLPGRQPESEAAAVTTNNELTRAAAARGPRLEQLLSEMGRRRDEIVNALRKPSTPTLAGSRSRRPGRQPERSATAGARSRTNAAGSAQAARAAEALTTTSSIAQRPQCLRPRDRPPGARLPQPRHRPRPRPTPPTTAS
jgi:hypothetical protein